MSVSDVLHPYEQLVFAVLIRDRFRAIGCSSYAEKLDRWISGYISYLYNPSLSSVGEKPKRGMGKNCGGGFFPHVKEDTYGE